MALPLATRLRNWIRPHLIEARRQFLNKVWGMDIGKGATISLKAMLDMSNPRGVHIGEGTSVNFDAVILTHDFVNNRHVDTRIGKMCHIGARSIIMPGVEVGDHSIVAVASVVMKNVPPHSLVAGNPARVMETGIMTGPRGMKLDVHQATVEGKNAEEATQPVVAGAGEAVGGQ
jgi:acetyltransferase-like isoleucine patch superfamily enzyme